MNFEQILERVERDVQVAANIPARVDDWKGLVNEVYHEIVYSRRWQWCEVDTDLAVYADEDVDGGSGSSNSTEITGVTTTYERWVGHKIVGSGGQEFTVVAVTSLGSVYITPAYVGSPPSGETWRVKYYRYALPRDCLSVQGLLSRDIGTNRIMPLTRRHDEELNLDPNNGTGTPLAWLPENVEADRPPRTFSAALASGASTLTVGTTYRYLCAFYQQGRLSSSSSIVTARPTSGTPRVTLTLEARSATSGITKWVYREDARSGVFRFLAEVASATTSYTDNGGTAPDEDQVWDDWGPPTFLRLYPRASTSQTLRLRYRRVPPRLKHASDTPLMPEVGQAALVHGAVAAILRRAGASSAVQERLMAKAISALASIEDQGDYTPARPSVAGRARFAGLHIGTASIT